MTTAYSKMNLPDLLDAVHENQLCCIGDKDSDPLPSAVEEALRLQGEMYKRLKATIPVRFIVTEEDGVYKVYDRGAQWSIAYRIPRKEQADQLAELYERWYREVITQPLSVKNQSLTNHTHNNDIHHSPI